MPIQQGVNVHHNYTITFNIILTITNALSKNFIPLSGTKWLQIMIYMYIHPPSPLYNVNKWYIVFCSLMLYLHIGNESYVVLAEYINVEVLYAIYFSSKLTTIYHCIHSI